MPGIVILNSTTLNLGVGAQQAGDYLLSAQGYPLKTHAAVLQYAYQGDFRDIAHTSFLVFDGTPPVVTIQQPSPGITVGSRTLLSVTALDDVSGVDRVEYRIDDRQWNYLPLSDAVSGRHSIAWNTTKADEGLRSIGFRAVDKAGNTSQPVSANVTVDLTAPAAPVIISPPNNSSVGTDSIDITGTSEPGATVTMNASGSSATQTCGQDGRFTFTGVKLKPGWNSFSFTAADKVGNVSQATSYAVNFTAMVSSISVDKPRYSPLENVAITSSMPNASSTDPLTNITAAVSVSNGQGQTLFSEDRVISRIDPLKTEKIVTNWNTATNARGQYSARLQVFKAGGVLSTSETSFEILGTSETGEGLSGTLAAVPTSVDQGSPEEINWSVRNDGNEDVAGLAISVVITNSATQAVVDQFTTRKTLLKGGGVSESHDVSTGSLMPGTYSAVLKAGTSAMPTPKALATASFEVKQGLQASQSIQNPANLLVWVSQKCHELRMTYRCDPDEHDGCVRVDLLQTVLDNSGASYRIVYGRDDFQREMRSSYYTDYMIVGDDEHLTDPYFDELVEQVYAGKGLITSSILRNWNGTCGADRAVLGIQFLDRLNSMKLQVDLEKSPLSDEGTLGVYYEGWWVEAGFGTTVAGWMSRSGGHRNEGPRMCPQNRYPGIVLNKYGEGGTIFFAFDLFSSLNDQNIGTLSPIIVNSINYVHRKTAAGSFLPSLLAPVQVSLTSPSSTFDVLLREAYSPALRIYDPRSASWVRDNPWTRNVTVGPASSAKVVSYALTPDRAGIYTLQTDGGYMSGGLYTAIDSLITEILVEKDRMTAASDILTALQSLSVSGSKDTKRLKSAKQSIRAVINRAAVSRSEMEKNVGDLLSAARNLGNITSCNVKPARLMIDNLIMSWEGQLYWGGVR